MFWSIFCVVQRTCSSLPCGQKHWGLTRPGQPWPKWCGPFFALHQAPRYLAVFSCGMGASSSQQVINNRKIRFFIKYQAGVERPIGRILHRLRLPAIDGQPSSNRGEYEGRRDTARARVGLCLQAVSLGISKQVSAAALHHPGAAHIPPQHPADTERLYGNACRDVASRLMKLRWRDRRRQ
jgi:hypothetical protein